MGENTQNELYLFKHVQNLGQPSVFPPSIQGKIQAAVQFIIPELKLGKHDKNFIAELASKCGIDVYAVDTTPIENKRTKQPATLVTLAFYVTAANSEDNNRLIMLTSRLLVERFLGLLSFFVGAKLSFVHLQVITVTEERHYKKILPSASRSSMPILKVELPPKLDTDAVPDDIFSALFWLRRGLAERDPIDTFSALMVCLEIMARHIVREKPERCPTCGSQSITAIMREFIVSQLGANPTLFKRLWKARNAAIAHGGKPITAEVLLELTELKFDTAVLAFQSIKLGFGMPPDSPPLPNQGFFVTDAFMYLD